MAPVKYRFILDQRFGRLLAKEELGITPRKWKCECDCGSTMEIEPRFLYSGNTHSCGCLRRDVVSERMTIHGEARRGKLTVEYNAWSNMRTRCYNPKNKYYLRYGGRGIQVCQRWRESFEFFFTDILEEIGRRPSVRHSIDRINNDGNYEPGNVKWSTGIEQQSHTSRSLLITHNGETRTQTEWARQVGIKQSTLSYRLKRGVPFAEAIKPVKGIYAQ